MLSDKELVHDMSSSFLWFLAFVLLVLIGFIIRILWNHYMSRVTVDLLVYGKKESATFTLLTLPGLRELQVQGTTIIDKVSLEKKGSILPYIRLTWADIQIVINGISIMLPTRFLIGPCTFSALSKVINQPFAAVLLIKQGSILLGHLGYMSDRFTPPNIKMGFCEYEGSKLNLAKSLGEASHESSDIVVDHGKRLIGLKRSKSFHGQSNRKFP